MDVNKLSTGQRIAGVAGLLLFIDLWMSWYGVDLGSIPGATKALVNAAGIDTTASAWQAFSYTDILVAITALVAVGMAVVAGTGAQVQLPVKLTSLTAGLGGAMTLLVLYRIINQPGPNNRITVEWGAYAGLILVGLVAYGGWRAMSEEAATSTSMAPPPPAPPVVPTTPAATTPPPAPPPADTPGTTI
jgi:hypothetical protein